MGFKEIYCSACKEKLGRYNEKYFSDDRLNQIIANNQGDKRYNTLVTSIFWKFL
jgi:hypothetical protein